MMRAIVRSSLRYPLLVVLVAGMLMALGVTQLPKARVDVLPEVSPPYVQVQTEALGLSAVEVEQLVTAPMEQQLLNGVAFLDEIHSESVPGLSSVEMFFEPGTDVFHARQLVQERLTQGQDLPDVSKAPVMLQPLSSTNRLMMVGLHSEALSLIEMSVLARWKIKPRLMGTPGVANVAIWGQREQQLQVLVDPVRLADNGVTLNQVIHTAGNALWVSPLSFLEASAPGSGGFVDTPNQRLNIQHILPIRTPQDLAQVSIEDTEGRRLRIGDVATVVENHQPLIGDAVVEDEPGLMLVIEKFPNASTVQVTRDVEAALVDLQPGMTGVTMDTTVFRPATFIETALDNIGLALLIGAVLLIVVLTVLLFDWRVALISMLAMVLSLLVAALLLHLRDGTFNTAVLVGLAVALAVVVDDAIVDIEEIRSRLRTRRAADVEAAPATILSASLGLRRPLMFATLALVLAAAPLLLLDGVTGSLVKPVVISYLLAVASSLVVALTLTPALAVLLLRGPALQRPDPPLARWLRRGYLVTLVRLHGRPTLVAATGAVLVVAGLFGLSQLGGQSVLPSLQDRTLLVGWEAAPGTSHPEMTRITARVSKELRAIPGVDNVGAHVGRAITGDQVSDVNAGDLWVTLGQEADYDATAARVRQVVDGYPGFAVEIRTYPDAVLARWQPEEEALVVRLFGQSLGVLGAKAEEVRGLLANVDGVVQSRVDVQATEPTVEIELDLEAAERYGIKPGDVRRAAAALVSGIEVGNLFEEQKVFEVVVWGTRDVRNSLNAIHALPIDLPRGGQVRLDRIADVRVTPNLTMIEHASVSRHVDVVADVVGDHSQVQEAVQARVDGVQFPLEHHLEVLDTSTARADSVNTVFTLGAAAAVLVFLLLQAAFNSWRLATTFFLTLPLALVGAVLAAVAAGGAFFPGSLLGVLTLLGLSLRNGIVLIRRYQSLVEAPETVDATRILRASADRVLPVVTVALALVAVLLPFVVLGTAPGYEVLRPLALVIIGGLVSSTLVTLFLLPILYIHVSRSFRHGAVTSTVPAGPALR